MYLKKKGKKAANANEEKSVKIDVSPSNPTEAGNGKYEVLELIGKGGFGKVYKCLCRETGAIYALKRINAKVLISTQYDAIRLRVATKRNQRPLSKRFSCSIHCPTRISSSTSTQDRFILSFARAHAKQTGDFIDIIMEYVEGGQVVQKRHLIITRLPKVSSILKKFQSGPPEVLL